MHNRTQKLCEALETSGQCPKGRLWRRYAQLWSQFVIVDGVLCRKNAPGPTTEAVTVPVLPKSLQQKALLQCHDSPGAGHQGFKKTLERLRRKAYWINMAQDVQCSPPTSSLSRARVFESSASRARVN